MSKKIVVAVAAVALALGSFLMLRPQEPKPSSMEAQPNPGPQPELSTLTVYSGRNEQLVGALFREFEKSTGIVVKVRYGETPQLAALLLEEGERTPADVYLAQDAGALGALAKAGRLQALPETLMAQVSDARFKSSSGQWVGLSGRARVLAYNTGKVKPSELPQSVKDLTRPEWQGRIGWAPTNASFQAFVTAFRILEGEAAAVQWLDGMRANQPRTYKNNTAIVEALGRGEVAVGLVNHYYVFAAEKGRAEPLPVANHYFAKDDPGALINVSGVAVLKGTKQAVTAHKLVEYLLGPDAQAHFARQTYEYPVVEAPGAGIDPRLRPIAEVGSPTLDLSELDALQVTVQLLQDKGVL